MNLGTLAHLGVAVALTPQGDLRLEAVPGRLTGDLLAQIVQCKPSLLVELGWQRERVNLVNMDSYGQAVATGALGVDRQVRGARPSRSLPPLPERVDPDAWQQPRDAYYAHHFTCMTCQAAGRGAYYGERCSTGLALFTTYQAYF